MITIFSAGKLSSLATQAVSTIRKEVFGRLDPGSFMYWTDADAKSSEIGSIRKIPQGKNRYAQFFRRLWWMHKTKPDIILFTGEFFEIFLYVFRPRKATTVFHLNGPLHESAWAYPYKTLRYIILWHSVAFFARHADAVVTITGYTASTIKRFRKNKPTYVIYNGVDCDLFSPERKNREYLHKTFDIDSDRPLAAYVGSLIARKRPDMVIEMAKRCPSVSFVLVGAASPEVPIRLLTKDVPNVQLIEHMERNDVATLLASADMFCFPALHEGFGMVVAEAMAAGCVPIVSAGSGPAEIVTDGNDGIVISKEGNECAAFVSSIQSTLSDSEKQKNLSLHATENARRRFDWNHIAREWEKTLKEIGVS